jgi:SPFH domain / Band 7 family
MPILQDYARDTKRSVEKSRIGRWIVGTVLALVLLTVVLKLFFNVNNHEVVALTYPNGQVEFFTAPGIYGQWLGHITAFEKRKKYDFEEKIQFNDGAYATIKGSVQYQIPLDLKTLNRLYQYYPTPDSIESGLIETNLRKSVILTGRTMSSKESYAERRGDLYSFMEDQIKHGPYQTRSRTEEIADDIDATKKKLATVVDILPDPKAPGGLGRTEPGLIEQYNVDISNFNFTVTYEDKVEKQIEAMQLQSQMINQSIAEAKQAEQRAITAEKNGQANAAQAKWDQEKINATQEAQNEQLVRNAELQKKEAEFKKDALILEGQGEAEKRQLIMNADGALQQKLAVYKETQQMWADAFKNYQGNLVPTIVSGSSGTANGGLNFMEILGAKAARDLSLDLEVPNGRKK